MVVDDFKLKQFNTIWPLMHFGSPNTIANHTSKNLQSFSPTFYLKCEQIKVHIGLCFDSIVKVNQCIHITNVKKNQC